MAERRENECSNCGAELEIDFSQETVQCPYCRTVFYVSDLIGDSDEVRISRINAKKDIEIEKGKREIEEKRLMLENERHEERLEDEQIYKFKKSFSAIIYRLMAIWCGVLVLCACLGGPIRLIIITVLQLAAFIVAYLMGIKVIPEKVKNMRTVFAIIGFLLTIPFIATFGSDEFDYLSEYNWEDVIVSDVLPKPESNVGEIETNENFMLSMDVENTNKKQFDEYISKCKEKGFTIEVEEELDEFIGFSEEGYELKVIFHGAGEVMSIILTKQEELKEMSWVDSALSRMIPKPEFTKGYVSHNGNSVLEVYIDMNKDTYKSYVDNCIATGFDIDCNRDEKQFMGSNAKGYTLYIEYEGNNVVVINLAKDN